VGDLAVWSRAAGWLAGFHGHFASVAARAKARAAAPLLSYDEEFYRLWPRRALAFSDAWPGVVRDQIAWVVERYEPVVERLVSMPVTVIHGEFYASNVLVQEGENGVRVRPVDWEMAAIGPGLIDLAALTAGSWSDDDRRCFVRAYFEGRAPHDAGWGSLEDLQDDFAYCRLHLAVQWLGWSAEWTPPREHAHDWLGEAVRLAEELRL
jgi:thiamine kinase-like enzyme